MSADHEAAGLERLLPFDTYHPQFTRGFEAGRIWTLLSERPDDRVDEVVHGVNAEMLLRMGDALGRQVRSRDIDETWIAVRFSPADFRPEETVARIVLAVAVDRGVQDVAVLTSRVGGRNFSPRTDVT